MNTTTKMKDCPDCEDGTYHVDTSRECTRYRNECCGGCGYEVVCETCNGTGEVEDEDESNPIG